MLYSSSLSLFLMKVVVVIDVVRNWGSYVSSTNVPSGIKGFKVSLFADEFSSTTSLITLYLGAALGSLIQPNMSS